MYPPRAHVTLLRGVNNLSRFQCVTHLQQALASHVCWSLQLEDASAQAAVRLLMLCMGVRA